MPYKDKEAKAANNAKYKKMNVGKVAIQRIKQLGQKNITQAVYD